MALFVVGGGVLCLAFVAMGGLLFYSTTYHPLRDWWAARDWREVSCTIERSELETRRDRDRMFWRVAIRYSYEVDGRVHHGERAEFGPSDWSNTFTADQRIVDAHPVGSRANCGVNPARPEDSVLSRGLSRSLFASAGLSLSLAAFGIVSLSIVAGVALVKLWPRRAAALASTGPLDPAEPANAIRLEPATSRGARLVPLVLAGVWNVFVVIMIVVPLVVMGLQDPMQLLYSLPFFLVIYSPFVLVGLGLLAWAGREILKTLGPRPVLRLDREPQPGGRATLHWGIEGRASKLDQVGIRVEGLERATYARGTDTTTDERIFFSQELLAATGPQVLAGGSVSLTVPAGTMPTFSAAHNAIVWRFAVSGAIRRWPDLDERFVFVVRPSVFEAR